MRWLWVWASLGLGGVGGLGAGPGEAIAEEPVREETLQSLSRLRQEDVREPRRVRVRGVVSTVGDGICSPDDWRVRSAYFYMEEGSGALWVPVFRARERGVWRGEEEFAKVEPGMEVEVEGDVSEGGFAPMLVPRTVRVLGRKALGPPLDPEWREVFTGGLRARRVRLSGVVQDVRLHRSVSAQVQAKVETGVGHFYVWLPERPEYAPGRLLDAEVEVTGAAVVLANWRGEFGHLRLMPMRAEDVVFRKQPGADPFEVEKVPLERLDSYVPGGRPLHRRRIEGEATYVSAASLPKPFVVVQSGGCAVRVHWAGEFPAGLRVGSRVEASGFIEASREVSDLSGAV
ncbi:MAG: hypothetical protein RLZZ142_1213, partial [Verrucomicrobiota bacterium]